MMSSLSDEQYRLLRNYLAAAKKYWDPYSIQLWNVLINADECGERIDLAGHAVECHTDQATVAAMLAGIRQLKRHGHDFPPDPWAAFASIGMEFGEPGIEPGRPLLSRGALRGAYEKAIRDIEDGRGTHQLQNNFYRQVADAVFNTCYDAIEHYTAWTDQHGTPERASRDNLRRVNRWSDNTIPPRLHVVSAPMGAGKTTFTTAFILAMAWVWKRHPEAPYGAVFLVDQIVKADGMFRELDKHLPGKVAIWTGDHDKGCTEPQKVRSPAARFYKHELPD
jgi:hypothetical protein